jgi:hypothetical protein
VAVNEFHITETPKSDTINVKYSIRRLSRGKRQKHKLEIKGNNIVPMGTVSG